LYFGTESFPFARPHSCLSAVPSSVFILVRAEKGLHIENKKYLTSDQFI